MKRLFIAVFALLSFVFADAQHSSNSLSPASLAPDVSSAAAVSLTLYNALLIEPPVQWTYATTFITAADYNGTSGAGDMGTNTWLIKSTKAGKVSLTFPNLMSNPPITTIIPVSKISYSVDNGTTWNTAAASVPNAATFSSGGNTQFNLHIKVNPGWSYPGGTYGGNLIVTATQL